MTPRAALGIKLHTGWAALVAVSGHSGKIQLLLRRRIELLPADSSIPRFVYHEAAELPLAQATELVKRATKASASTADLAVKEALREVGSRGIQVDVCGVLSGSRSAPVDLAAILRSHPLIHTAEGALFQDAIVTACGSCGLRVVLATEREVWTSAAAALGVTEPGLRKEVDALRKALGAPWSADHKASTAVALLALNSKRA
jgi:hypothetical protein